MEILKKEIEGLCEIILSPLEDERGFFMRTYERELFREWQIDREWTYEAHSFSKTKGTVRGLHFQHPPHCEAKLERAILGEIFFAVIDLRKGSKTFGKHATVVLSAKKNNMLFVPRGCAQGMCTLTEDCHLLYKFDNFYSKKHEDNILWNDPDLGIKWPLTAPSVISERDKNAQTFGQFLDKTKGGLEP